MAKELEVIEDKFNWHWRNTMRTVRFFAFDGRAAFPIIFLFFYARLVTLLFFIGTLLFFRFLEQKGLTLPAALRNFRASFVGLERPGWLSIYHRKFKDFG